MTDLEYLAALENLESVVSDYIYCARVGQDLPMMRLTQAWEKARDAKIAQETQVIQMRHRSEEQELQVQAEMQVARPRGMPVVLMEKYYAHEMDPVLRKVAYDYLHATTSTFSFILGVKQQLEDRGALTDKQLAAVLNCKLYDEQHREPTIQNDEYGGYDAYGHYWDPLVNITLDGHRR